jgi:serine/threonine protein kinase
MTPELWKRLKPLFHAALKKSTEGRAAFIVAACKGDAELKMHLEQLIEAEMRGTQTIDAPLAKLHDLMDARNAGFRWQDGSMLLAKKTRFGPYEIIALLGVGGMGEVYKARDTRLDRMVAIKICKGQFTERFEREARAISSLNHPHICALYDIGREDSIEFLVMEYLEGESLQERLRRGALSIAEALQIAIQIASALDAAHRKEVIHRDLKPSNIILTRSGAKLLDFGLAKISKVVSSHTGMNPNSTTSEKSLTGDGTIIGTLQYMPPEQLEGKETDARSDIFSFGAVTYEVITGRKCFQGSSRASLIAAVMSIDPPPVSTMQPMASPGLDRVVRRCLAKLPDDRWQSASDLLSELEWITETRSTPGILTPASPERRNHDRSLRLAVGVAAVLFLLSLIWLTSHRRNEPGQAALVRFEIPVPDKLNFFYYEVPAISPDGEHIAFTAVASMQDNERLFVRSLNAAAATEIPVSNLNPNFPFWSPDGREIAFSSRGTLQRVSISGGPPIVICNCSALGGTWNRDGVIIFANRSLFRVSAAGGDPKPLKPLAEGETGQRWPQFLPDGKHYMYLSLRNRPGQQGIYIASLDSNEPKFIVASNAGAAYVQSGQLLFMRGDLLMAQQFDLRKLELKGEPRTVAEHIELAETSRPGETLSSASFTASFNGVLVWRRRAQSFQSSLRWFDRKGRRLGIVGAPADFSDPALSPDDNRLAVAILDPEKITRDIWIFDLLNGTKKRLTFDPADDCDPVWSPDGTRIAFSSNRKGQRDIYQIMADGSGPAELLIGGNDGNKDVEDWSRDGKYLVYNYNPLGQANLYVQPLGGERMPVPFVSTKFRTMEGQFSPNSRWIAYRSSESGRPEIYVEGLSLDSSRQRGKWQVSIAGGELPRWRRDGKELFFHAGSSYFSVDVKTDSTAFEAGIPKPLFEASTVSSIPIGGSPFAVTRDGRRFLVLAEVTKQASEPLEVLVNWR